MMIRWLFGLRRRRDSPTFRSIRILYAKVQLHEVTFFFDAVHVFDEAPLLFLLDHRGKEIIIGLTGTFQGREVRPYPF